MADVTKLKDNVQEAQAALDLMNNPTFKKAMSVIETQYLEAALVTDDDNQRRELLEGIKVTRLLKRQLSKVAQAGKLAASDLKMLQDEPPKKKRFKK